MIQCEDGYSNHDLISCAKFNMMEVLSELKSKLNPQLPYYFHCKTVINKTEIPASLDTVDYLGTLSILMS